MVLDPLEYMKGEKPGVIKAPGSCGFSDVPILSILLKTNPPEHFFSFLFFTQRFRYPFLLTDSDIPFFLVWWVFYSPPSDDWKDREKTEGFLSLELGNLVDLWFISLGFSLSSFHRESLSFQSVEDDAYIGLSCHAISSR